MRSTPLKVAVHNPLNNGSALERALERSGHEVVTKGRADVFFIELDMPKFEFRGIIDSHKAMGTTVLLYPHGAGFSLWYDSLYEPYDAVDGSLVFGAGQCEMLRRLEYPKPTHAMGWSYCDLAPFRARRDVRHVVFAPTHPSGRDHGTLAEALRAGNAETYAQLLKGPWRLTVRHFGTLEQNGLWPANGVNSVPASRDKSPIEIEAADAVVAGNGTFPSLAIARGVPTVVYDQVLAPMYGLPDEERVSLRRPELYRDYLRYPFDVSDGPLDEVIHAAARSEAPIADWKRRFIGAQFDDLEFAALIERLAADPAPTVEIDDTRSFTIVGFADEIVQRPELLAAYAEAFGPEDDATLVLWGPGLDPVGLLDLVQRAAVAAGVDDDQLPDILLLPLPGSREADHCLAARARAVLSEWPAAGRIGELPRYGASGAAALRGAAAAQLNGSSAARA
jgi:hypothetical protein